MKNNTNTSTKAVTEIRNKLLFTIGIIVVYRFITYIPIPFIDPDKISEFSELVKTGIFGMFNMLSGGSIARISVLTLGIMPYITSSIVMQLLSATTPELKKLKTEGGEDGQTKINQYTKYLAICVALFQGFMMSSGFISMGLYSGSNILYFKIFSSFTMATGTMIVLWLSDICTAKGIGNGSSIIICAGILAEAPRDLMNVLSMSKNGSITPIMLLVLFLIFAVTVFFVIFMERSNRLIPIQYPRQAYAYMGKMDSAKNNFMPLKLNSAGVMPPIFASAVLLFPITIVSVSGMDKSSWLSIFIGSNFSHGKPLFVVSFIMMITFFSFFYNSVIFDTNEISDNLKKSGVFIPGQRPGQATSAFLKKILKRLSLLGAIYLSIICSVPELLSPVFGYSFLLGGTGVLIVISVIMDTMINVQSHLLYSKYYKKMNKKI